MAAFGIPPSRKIGEIKKALEASIEAGEIQSHQPIEYYLELLLADRTRYGL
jgi:poly(A) polymerase